MSKKNMCAVLHGVEDLRLEERPIPTPGADEVQISMRSVGLCGSDLSLYQKARVGTYPLKHPMVLGHEPCGQVSAVGALVTDLVVGDRVALSPREGCGKCSFCKSNHCNVCPELHMMCKPPTDGCLANFIVWPARLCYKIPDSMTWEEGALVQPMALAVYGCQRAGVKEGQRVLVCGAGPLSMVMVIAVKAIGVSRICVTDICKDRLQFLSSATGCMTARADVGTPADVAKQVTSLLGGEPDVTLECSGAAQAVSTAIHATKAEGCILIAGIGPPEVQIPLLTAMLKEVDIRSMIGFIDTYPTAIDLISSRKVDVTALVTQTFELSDVTQAFQAMKRKEQGKFIVKISSD